MNKKFLSYFLAICLLIPYPLVYAGGVCCKAQAKLPALEQAVADLAKAVAKARSWQKWENMIFYSALNTALFKGFIVLECYKKEKDEPVSMVQDLITHGPGLYTLFEDIYAIAGNAMALGSTQELIYKLFVIDRADNDAETTELLAGLVLHRKTIKEPKVTYDVFLATRAAEFIKKDKERIKNEERNKAFAKKQKEEASFWNDLFSRSAHNRRIDSMYGMADKLRTLIAACQESYRYKISNKDKNKFDKHLRAAFQECFEILRTVQSIDPAAVQPFIDSLKESTKKASKKSEVPITLYTLFEQVFALSQDVINPRSTDEFLGVLAQIKPEHIPHKPLQDVLAIAVGFRANKKQTADQNKEIQRAIEAEEKGATEEAQLKEKKAVEEAMLAKIKELELQKKADDEKKKLEEQEAEKKAKDDEEAQRKSLADKKAVELAKEKKKKRKEERQLQEAAALKEIAEKARLRRENESAQESARVAKQLKDYAEKQKEEMELQALAALQTALLNNAIAEKKAEKERELQQFQQASKSRRLRTAFLKWQSNTAKPLAVANAYNDKRVQKHSFELWKKEFQRREKIKEGKRAQENAKKQAQETLATELKHHFEKHYVKKTSGYLDPLVEAEHAAVANGNNYQEWFNNHCDSLIYGATYNYLFNKSTFKTNKPKLRVDCVFCDSFIDKATLEQSIKDMHWSDFRKSKNFQDVNHIVKIGALQRAQNDALTASIGKLKANLQADLLAAT